FDVRLLRFDHPDAPSNEEATAHLRVTVKDQDESKVGRAFSNAATELALAGYAGFHTTAPPGGASAFGVYWPALIPAALVTQEVHLPDGSTKAVRSPEYPPPAQAPLQAGSAALPEPAAPPPPPPPPPPPRPAPLHPPHPRAPPRPSAPPHPLAPPSTSRWAGCAARVPVTRAAPPTWACGRSARARTTGCAAT